MGSSLCVVVVLAIMLCLGFVFRECVLWFPDLAKQKRLGLKTELIGQVTRPAVPLGQRSPIPGPQPGTGP